MSHPPLPRLCRCLLAAVVLTTGCGGPKVTFNPKVEGVVTLDGQPLPNVLVRFIPEAVNDEQLPISHAITDEQGRFQLKYQSKGKSDQPGAVLGKHLVLVTDPSTRSSRKKDEQTDEVVVRRVPDVYGLTHNNPLSCEVTADRHDYPLVLSNQ